MQNLLIFLDENYYAGVAYSEDCADGTATTDVPLPPGMLVDANHCPKFTPGKKPAWVNDDSPAAKAISAKYHVSDLPFGIGDSSQPQAKT
jgi:hypothetical protein